MNDKYFRGKELAIAALVLGKSYAQAAQAAGVERNTLWDWRKRDDFQADYRAARRRVVEDAIAKAQAAMTEAVEALRKNLKDANPAVVNTAAKTLLDIGRDGVKDADLIEAFEKMKAEHDGLMKEREERNLGFTGQIRKIR